MDPVVEREPTISAATEVVLFLVFVPLGLGCLIAAPFSAGFSLPWAALFFGVVGWAADLGREPPSTWVRALLLGGAALSLLELVGLVVWGLT